MSSRLRAPSSTSFHVVVGLSIANRRMRQAFATGGNEGGVTITNPDTTKVIYRDLNGAYPTIVRGEGIYLFDAEGNRYIDGSGGSAAVTAIGHGVSEVIEAMTAQAHKLAYAPMHAFSTEPIESFARLIAEEFAPAGLERVWFVSGGSEATENAVKMALQYQR